MDKCCFRLVADGGPEPPHSIKPDKGAFHVVLQDYLPCMKDTGPAFHFLIHFDAYRLACSTLACSHRVQIAGFQQFIAKRLKEGTVKHLLFFGYILLFDGCQEYV